LGFANTADRKIRGSTTRSLLVILKLHIAIIFRKL
jgi:hypothetical protein